jgi:hypothetical protein
MAPVHIRLMGNPEDLPRAAALIMAAAAERGWTTSELLVSTRTTAVRASACSLS